MTNPNLDDSLDRILREDARRRVPDAGFSKRVEGALPPPTASLWWLRPALLLASAVIGGGLAWHLAPAGLSLAQGFLDLARLQSLTPSASAALGVALGMAVVAAVLAVEEN